MLSLFCITLCVMFSQQQERTEKPSPVKVVLAEFRGTEECRQWVVINDDVMGGVSRSELTCSEGRGHFQGRLSLLNNGGFASIRRLPGKYGLHGVTGIGVHVKGDGRPYQVRLRTSSRADGIAWKAEINPPKGEWVQMEIPLENFVPVFRGRVLKGVDPLVADEIQQVGFLIADKDTTPFSLQIQSIWGVAPPESP